MKYDVAITGGGMVGMALACALAREGVRTAVIERAEPELQLQPEFDGRVSAVALSSQRLLAAIGTWDGMEPHAQPILDIRVSDSNSPFFLHYDHREVSDEPFGWIVENRHIRRALALAAAHHRVEIIAPAEITGWEARGPGARLRLSDGEEITAALAVAADGKRSALRELAGIRVMEACYRQVAIVCTIAHEHAHKGLAQERFLPAGPFAVLPMSPLRAEGEKERSSEALAKEDSPRFGGLTHRSSLVWTEAAEHAAHFLVLPEAEFVQEIRERVGSYPGAIRTVGPRFSYPLSFVHVENYTAPRLALIGDAAHAIHPIAGQGVNLGWRDVAALADILGKRARLGLDIGTPEALAAYQRWRRFDNLAMLAVTDSLNRLFGSALPPVALARGLGLWAVAHLPPAKRFFMRHAMGLAGDLPPLLKKAA